MAAWPMVQELVQKEFDSVRSDGADDQELERAKRNICGSIVLALESMNPRMMRMTKNELYHGREIPVEETLGKINAVTKARLQDLANRILDPGLVSTTAIGPF